MKFQFRKALASLLCMLMLVGTIPANAFAAEDDLVQEASEAEVTLDAGTTGGNYFNVLSETSWDIASGIKETEYVLDNAGNSRRQVVHIMEVDISNPETRVLPSYMGMNPTPGNYRMGTMSEQAQWVEENMDLNVVGAMNTSLSWYDSDYYVEHPELKGEPTGLLIIDGVVYSKKTSSETCLVINYDTKEGEARPSDIPKVELRYCTDELTGWEEQAIPCNFDFLVKDGVNLNSVSHASAGSKSILGIKADGTVVLMQNDGRLAPYSSGMSNYEAAEIMLQQGCVDVVRCDGGGTSTYLSQRPGEELKVNNAPSDGEERDTTTGILVISTAAPDLTFHTANITAEYTYYAPGSKVVFTAVGASASGHKVDIPEDAVWQIQQSDMGTIDNGLFTSNGTTGDVTVQLVYEDAVVGSCTIHIVKAEDFTGTDFFLTAEGKVMYLIDGEPVIGYRYLNGKPYYFDENGFGFHGKYSVAGEVCRFEDGQYVECTSADLISAGLIGPKAGYALYTNGTLKIAGSGDTYDFSNHGSRPYGGVDWRVNRVEIAKGITSIGSNLLMNTSVAEVVFEEGSEVTRIGKNAFKQCYKLTEITLPNKVETLEAESFGRSTNLKKIVLPKSVKSIAANSFSECGQLTLHAEKESYALQYAQDNGINYQVLIPSVPMYRMYDPNSGEHFYSGSTIERDFLVSAGWHYEGVGFNFPEEGAPVHRLYEPVHGEHLYTMDEEEMNELLAAGWNYEGVAFNSATEDEVPQYRLRNPNAKRGGYHFTGSTVERDFLVSIGWIPQGIGWYSCVD